MRKILFRGKRVDNSEWVEGDFLSPHNIVWTERGFDEALQREEMIVCDEAVDPETVGEYTGLTDKNGKRIFEGDIICVLEKITCVSPTIETKLNYTVIYKDGSFRTKGNDDEDFTMDDMPLQYLQFVSEQHNNLVEIIGNIHDNPELLEVEE